MAAILTQPNDIKERLSLAYLTAVAARAGCEVHERKVDRNGIDATVRPIAGSPAGIDVQMKASSSVQWLKDEATLAFSLDTPTYDKLRREDTSFPQLLVLFEMPNDDSKWLVTKHPTTTLQHLAYWVDLYGKPPVEGEHTTIHFSSTNVFDSDAINAIIEKAHALALSGKSWSP
jgi:hypothetical protein